MGELTGIEAYIPPHGTYKGGPEGFTYKAKRSATVEPVFGTLTEFMGMRKVNTRGIGNANKGMLMAATAYNLKKLLKFTAR